MTMHINGPRPQTPEQQLTNAARDLPDELVADDSKIQVLAAIAKSDQARLTYRSRTAEKLRVRALVPRLQSELDAARQAHVLAAISDAADDDLEFFTYVERAGHIACLEHRLKAAQTVLAFFETDGAVLTTVQSKAEASRQALEFARIEAKRRLIQAGKVEPHV